MQCIGAACVLLSPEVQGRYKCCAAGVKQRTGRCVYVVELGVFPAAMGRGAAA